MDIWLLSLVCFHVSTSWCLPRRAASENTHYFDVQGHRGGRLFLFDSSYQFLTNTEVTQLKAPYLVLHNGVTTLELDNGITKDGVVVTWHDENIVPEKCRDTAPALPDDPEFPYVGKFVVDLTLAQLKTLDCGSKRQRDFPLQLTYPRTTISTLQEVFDFVQCADPERRVLFNIESKIDAQFPNLTAGVDDFVKKQHTIFVASPYRDAITYQSFDWRSLIGMKKLDSRFPTAALISSATATVPDNSTTPWLAGLRLDSFPGTFGEQVAQAAHPIGADILSPSDVASPLAPDPTDAGFIPFTTRDMVSKARKLGLEVKPWTVNRLSVAEYLLDWGVDGLITDYPVNMRRFVQQRGLPVAPKHSKKRVLDCLEEHLQRIA